MHLVLAVTVRAQSAAHGVRETNAAVNVVEIFNAHVLPELQAPDLAARPIVKAGAIKFASTFRNQLPVETVRQLMPLLGNHLAAEQVVLHTYAAACIERFLGAKDGGAAGGAPKFGRAELRPFLQPLVAALFALVEKAEQENEYVMKAIMRALSVAEGDVMPVTGEVLAKIKAALARVCANPRNPRFNHFLFESIAVLVRAVCGQDGGHVGAFEDALFPPFQTVLQMDVAEFTPYVFQAFARRG